jgi:regulator of sirC expression with transglutaminase-like and TPR domain
MNLDHALELLARDPDAALDLAEVGFLLARDEYPSLNVQGALSDLDALAQQVRPSLRGNPRERLQVLCDHLFGTLGFHGNSEDYYDPRNSYLSDVLQRRTGIPITLSALTMALGRRLDLNIAGVGLPGHFVAKLIDPQRGDVLFDPFHGGRVLSTAECEDLVQRVTGVPFEASAQSLRPFPLGAIVFRMLGNLRSIYHKQEDWPRLARTLTRMVQLDPQAPVLRRDLGQTLMRQGKFGQAIDHLAFYVRQAPEADDVDAIRDLLAQARRLLAQWN